MLAPQFSSAIKYPTAAAFTVALSSDRSVRRNLCAFFFLFALSLQCIHLPTDSVFLLTLDDMIFMHLLYFRCTVCVYTFKLCISSPAAGLVRAEDLAFFFSNTA